MPRFARGSMSVVEHCILAEKTLGKARPESDPLDHSPVLLRFGHLFVTPRQGPPIGVVDLASGLEAGLLLISERPVPVSG